MKVRNFRGLRLRPLCATTLVLLLAFAMPAFAQQRGLDIIRDAETEAWLRELATPVFEQAGIPPGNVNIVLVQSPEINAFVAGGMNMFIYTGLLRATRTPDEVLGVIAHELGHIAGGHLIRTRDEIRNTSATAILATIVGVAAAAASSNGAAGAAAVSLGHEVAKRNYLSYSRTQESAADQAALRYLDGAGISADGMHEFLRRLQDQELLPEDQQSEFVRTHPLTRERVESVAAHIEASPGKPPLPPAATASYQRIMAKLNGYLDPRSTLQKIGPGATSPADRIARATALHRTGDTQGAITLMDGLIREEPNNPYLYEFKGQILYESGQPGEAVAPYQRAVTLSGGNALLRVGLAQALLARAREGDPAQAVTELEAALTAERQSPLLWRLLATAYGHRNDLGMAAYALAEEAATRGEKAVAIRQAKQAQEMLPKGSPGWLRAGDVLANNQNGDGDDDGPERKK